MSVKLHLNFNLTASSYKGIDQTVASIWKKKNKSVELLMSKELKVSVAEVTVTFAGSALVKKMNRDYRGKEKTTDVLSFPVHEMPSKIRGEHLLLGDLFIDLKTAEKQAKVNELTLDQEITRLMIHGLYHLLGYDHELSEKDGAKMRRCEQKMVDLFKIPITV